MQKIPACVLYFCVYLLSLTSICSDLLDRPVENLLMNQTTHFRQTQEQREFLTQVKPLVQSGYV